MSMGQWAHKPWMQPTRYRDDVDASLQQEAAAPEQHLTSEQVEDAIEGESLQVEWPALPDHLLLPLYKGTILLESRRAERSVLPDLGDSRPDPALKDNTPMEYKQARYDRQPVLDIDDRDELD